MIRTESYYEAIQSSHWRNLRNRMIWKHGRTCSRCGFNKIEPGAIELHHKHYQTLGEETEDDVELVCKECHPKADAERARQSQARSRRALKEAAFNTWCENRGCDGDESDWEDFSEWWDNRNDW
jgi:hypothetical protein